MLLFLVLFIVEILATIRVQWFRGWSNVPAGNQEVTGKVRFDAHQSTASKMLNRRVLEANSASYP